MFRPNPTTSKPRPSGGGSRIGICMAGSYSSLGLPTGEGVEPRDEESDVETLAYEGTCRIDKVAFADGCPAAG